MAPIVSRTDNECTFSKRQPYEEEDPHTSAPRAASPHIRMRPPVDPHGVTSDVTWQVNDHGGKGGSAFLWAVIVCVSQQEWGKRWSLLAAFV